jgi:dethiobiotin synthetase
VSWPRPSGRGFFVTGTDTGVGKTVVSTGLVRGLRARRIDAVGMKPIETGVGAAGPLDGLALHEAAGGVESLDEVCPERFALPAAPGIAAEEEGRRVDLARLRGAFARLQARHACVVAEGAGGLLVPVAPGLDMADLAAELALPVLVVARASLGTVNHTRLTLEALERRGLVLAGVMVSHAAPLSHADARNLELLRRLLGAQLVGEVPPLAPGACAPPECFGWDRLLPFVV